MSEPLDREVAEALQATAATFEPDVAEAGRRFRRRHRRRRRRQQAGLAVAAATAVLVPMIAMVAMTDDVQRLETRPAAEPAGPDAPPPGRPGGHEPSPPGSDPTGPASSPPLGGATGSATSTTEASGNVGTTPEPPTAADPRRGDPPPTTTVQPSLPTSVGPPSTRPSGGQRVTAREADDGQVVRLRVGDELVVALEGSPDASPWSPAETSDAQILQVVSAEQVGAGSETRLRGLRPGRVEVTATQEPACDGPCPLSARVFRITVDIEG